MSSDLRGNDPAAVVMSLDAIGQLLGRASDLAEAGLFITRTLRELAGARLVVLVRWAGDQPGNSYRVVGVEPARRRPQAERPEFALVAQVARDQLLTTLLDNEPSSPWGPALAALGFDCCLCVPLRLAHEAYGCLLAFDVSRDDFLPSISVALSQMAPALTLLLRQSELIEEQAETIEQRRRAEAALRWELEANQAWAAVSRVLCQPGSSPVEVARVALESARRVTASAEAGVVEVDADGRSHLLAATASLLSECALLNADGRCQLCRQAVCQSPPVGLTSDAVGVGRPQLCEVGEAALPELNRALVATVWLGSERVGHIAVAHGEADYLPRQIDALVGIAELFGLALQRRRNEVRRGQLEEQLRQAGRLEAVGQLAGGVAHDFNNMLTAIMGFAEFVDGSLEPADPLRGDVGEILKAAHRAAELTAQLLAFGRRQVIRQQVLDLNAVVRDYEPMITRLIGEDIRLTVELGEPAGHIVADRGQIGQVLMNLVVNAKHAMPNGGDLLLRTAQVEVGVAEAAAHAELSPGCYVQLEVTDTGCGIDAVTQQRIFEPFFTTRGPGEGSGLGLATVFGIVGQHHGAIDCHSEPGRGTSFRVLLPRVLEAPADETAPPAPADDLSGHETVMVVEDEDGLRALCLRALAGQGYTALGASCAEEALARLADLDAPPDLLVTDVVMPGMSGLDLVRRLTADGLTMPVVFVSGYAGPAIDPAELGVATCFVQKPFSPSTLLQAVRRQLATEAVAPPRLEG